MDLFTAKKLTALRKYSSLSQEALAEKVGVSRQAVSKWERGEASPDTDNILSLSRIYSVSTDDILGEKSADELIKQLEAKKAEEANGKEVRSLDTKGPATEVVIEEKPSEVSAGDIYYADFKKEKTFSLQEACTEEVSPEKKAKRKKIHLKKREKLPPLYPSLAKNLLKFPYIIIAALIFVLLGFFKGLWHPGWLVFLSVPAYYLSALAFFAPTKKKILRRLPIYYFAILIFLSLGILFNLWAYAWFIFLLVPLYYWGVSFIKK